MRKFKISERVARKMKELGSMGQDGTKETPEAAAEAKDAAPDAVPEKKENLRVTSRTDVGLVRKNNQDAVIMGSGLMGIADGKGGHRGGPAGDRMLIAHVGDSRVYLLREGKIRQVTRDHSMVADMVRKGLLTEDQAAVHPMRNYITRAVGTEPEIQVDLLGMERQTGDRWLVCSDGLHGLLEKEELRKLMAGEDPEEAADQMVREALDRGGRDNISLVLVCDDGPAGGEVAE